MQTHTCYVVTSCYLVVVLFQTLICATSFATFAVDRKLPQNRLQLSITLMLTAVTFRLTTNANLPKISYHTRLVSTATTTYRKSPTTPAW